MAYTFNLSDLDLNIDLDAFLDPNLELDPEIAQELIDLGSPATPMTSRQSSPSSLGLRTPTGSHETDAELSLAHQTPPPTSRTQSDAYETWYLTPRFTASLGEHGTNAEAIFVDGVGLLYKLDVPVLLGDCWRRGQVRKPSDWPILEAASRYQALPQTSQQASENQFDDPVSLVKADARRQIEERREELVMAGLLEAPYVSTGRMKFETFELADPVIPMAPMAPMANMGFTTELPALTPLVPTSLTEYPIRQGVPVNTKPVPVQLTPPPTIAKKKRAPSTKSMSSEAGEKGEKSAKPARTSRSYRHSSQTPLCGIDGEPPLVDPLDAGKSLLFRRQKFASHIREISGLDLSKELTFTNYSKEERETAIENLQAVYPQLDRLGAHGELCHALGTWVSGNLLLAMWPILGPDSFPSTNPLNLSSPSLEQTVSSPTPPTPQTITSEPIPTDSDVPETQHTPQNSPLIDPYPLEPQVSPIKMEDQDRNTGRIDSPRGDEHPTATAANDLDNAAFEALCAPFLSNTPVPQPVVINQSKLSNFECHVLAAIPDLLTKVVVPAPSWARHWIVWHEAINPALLSTTVRILFDRIKRYNYQLQADEKPERVRAMKLLKADTGAIKAYLAMRLDSLDLNNQTTRRVSLSEAYLRLAYHEKLDYISADYVHTSIIECYKHALEEYKVAKAASQGPLIMPEDLAKLQQALNYLKTRMVKGLGILGARPSHLPPVAGGEQPQQQTPVRKPAVPRWAPKQSYPNFPAAASPAEKERLKMEQQLYQNEARGPLKLVSDVCPIHFQWHMEHLSKPNITKSQLLARLKKYQQDYALGSFSPHRNWSKISAGGLVTLMDHIELRLTHDDFIPEDSPEKEGDFNELPDNDRVATFEERLPSPTPAEEEMIKALKIVRDLNRDHALKLYKVILKCVDNSEVDLKLQCANFRRECLEICRDILFERIQGGDFGPPPMQFRQQAQGVRANPSVAAKQDANKLTVNHGTPAEIQRKRQASPNAMVPDPIKKEFLGYPQDGSHAKHMAPSATLPEAPRVQAPGGLFRTIYPPIPLSQPTFAPPPPTAPAIPRSFTISEPHRVIGPAPGPAPEAGPAASFSYNPTVEPTDNDDIVMLDGQPQQVPTWYQHLSGHPIRPPAAYTTHRRNARSSESRGSFSNPGKGGMVKSDTINKTVSGGVKKAPTMRKSMTLKAMQKASAKEEAKKPFDMEGEYDRYDRDGQGGAQGGNMASSAV
ncbi:hypothetical protein BZA77DRAFT_385256 [Pyronema omphalodes]|nr:hypothetical protein BZA77DRAFT_385256 [Pyronema omphalodes]